jgi:hypothetical protein
MKHKILLLSIVLGLALPASVSMASEDNSAEMKPDVQKVVKPKAKKKVKRHSHVEEKTGVPVKAPDESMPDTAGADAAKKQQHLHPRDMK